MSKYLDEARRILPYLQKGAQNLTNVDVLKVRRIYPKWEDLVELGSVQAEANTYKFIYNNELYFCINANPTFSATLIPGVGTEALYTRIDEDHSGSQIDPIPYSGNMALEEGKYYIQDGVVYYCFRDTEAPVFKALIDLNNIYVLLV